jgi:hypothetical protein
MKTSLLPNISSGKGTLYADVSGATQHYKKDWERTRRRRGFL